MPANKVNPPNTSTNVATYPHAANLIVAWEAWTPAISQFTNWTADIDSTSPNSLTESIFIGAGGTTLVTTGTFDEYGQRFTSSFGPSGGDLVDAGTPGQILDNWTWETRFTINGGANPTSAGYLYFFANFGGGTVHNFTAEWNASGQIVLSINGGTITCTGTPAAGTVVHLIVVFDNTAGSAEAWINGTSQGTVSYTTVAVNDAYGLMASNDGTFGAAWDWTLYFQRVYNTALSSGAVADQFAEPYAVTGATLAGALITIAPTGDEASSTGVDLALTLPLVASGSETSNTLIELAAARILEASEAETSDVALSIARALTLASTGPEASAVAVDLARALAVSVSQAETSAVTVDLARSLTLAATASEASSAVVDLARTIAYTAAGAEGSSVVVDIDEESFSTIRLTSTGSEASSTSLSLAVARVLSATGAEASTVSVDLGRLLRIVSAGAETSATDVSLAQRLTLLATGAETSDVVVDIDVDTGAIRMTAVGNEASAVDVSIGARRTFEGFGAEASLVLVDIDQETPLVGELVVRRSTNAGTSSLQVRRRTGLTARLTIRRRN